MYCNESFVTTVQNTRSVLQRYTAEFQNRVRSDHRVGIVIDGEVREIWHVFIAVTLLQKVCNVKYKLN